MSLAFITREPTPSEVEKLRLVLSTFQDGSGMNKAKRGDVPTLPGWRDFERAISIVFNGEAPESKALFDVLLTDPANKAVKYGLSCKMRRELSRILSPKRDGRATIEESNSDGEFKDYIKSKGISESEYRTRAAEVGQALIEVIQRRKQKASVNKSAIVDIAKSCYVLLLWDNKGKYQLYQFTLDLPRAEDLHWHYSTGDSRHINGDNEDGGRVFEWYPGSGGQLKYYPHPSEAVWRSEVFELEPLGDKLEYGLVNKAAAYFPEAWDKASDGELD